jgi:hypothetical protein
MRLRPIQSIAATAFALSLTSGSIALELKFGWRPGMACQVQNSMVMSQPGGNAEFTLRYTLKVSAATDSDLYVGIENPSMDPVPGTTAEQRNALAAQLAAVNMPAIRVKTDGEVVGLRDYEAARKELRAAYQRFCPPPPIRGPSIASCRQWAPRNS